LNRHDRNPPPTRPSNWRSLILRRADQAGVAALAMFAVVALIGWWLSHGGAGGRLIEIEHAPRQSANLMVDINRADWPELAVLPGIGETLAKRIVSVRTNRGSFADHDELARVPGIGPRTMERLRPYLLPMAETHSVAGQKEHQGTGG
jgi:competence protein ComEA